MKIEEKNAKASELIEAYRNGDEYAVSDFIEMFGAVIKDNARQAAKMHCCEDDYISAQYFALYEFLQKADVRLPYSVALRKLKEAVADVKASKQGSYEKHVVLAYSDQEREDGEEIEADVFDYNRSVGAEIGSNRSVEDEVIDRLMIVPRAELIDYLYEKADEDGRAIIQAILDNSEHVKSETPRGSKYRNIKVNISSIARETGIEFKKIKRKLQKISEQYNVSLFGDINDYLPRLGYTRSI